MAYRASIEALQAQFLIVVAERDLLGDTAKDEQRRRDLQQQIELLSTRIDYLTPGSYIPRYTWAGFVGSVRASIAALIRSLISWKSLGVALFGVASVMALLWLWAFRHFGTSLDYHQSAHGGCTMTEI